MRLTLRTLLAYLDHTLEPQDVELLREKLGESGFATQLVRRIEQTLANGQLAAPSAEAVGPVDEANVISEYLDSTLPAEQVAEIERACLDSDIHLAEAAACHQILTLVLGRKADVPDELRQRIYELPERNVDEIAVAGSFSSVAIPPAPDLGPSADVIATADTAMQPDGNPVEPVGKGDSGVSDAPTRIRQTQKGGGSVPKPGSVIAGSKPRLADDQTRIYGGSIRSSRLAPWLVSLALTAVVLFLLTRIFAPLLNPNKPPADESTVVANAGDAATVGAPSGGDEPDAVTDKQPPEAATDADTIESLPPVEAVPDDEASEEDDTSRNEAAPSLPPPNEQDGSPDEAVPNAAAVGEPSTPDSVMPSLPPQPDANDPSAISTDSTTGTSTPSSPDSASEDPAIPSLPPQDTESAEMPVPAPDDDSVPVEPAGDDTHEDTAVFKVAKVTGDESLLVARVGDQDWVQLPKDAVLSSNVTVLSAPTYRSRLELTDRINVMMVGPSEVRWVPQDGRPTLQVVFGRVLLSASEPDVRANILLGDLPMTVTLPDVDSIVATSVKKSREPGVDALQGPRTALAGVLSVRGGTTVSGDGFEQALTAGQQWIRTNDDPPTVTALDAIPEWIDPPDPKDATLEKSAREGLLAILGGGQSLEVSLLEGTKFRRDEVAALAAETLLFMGRPDVYFGGDGVLNDPKQRIYWSNHYRALMDSFDHSREQAAAIMSAASNMDGANAASIRRLLTGYSNEQLKAGGDEQLVELLDSPSMSVRVLALENLHEITGTTLYFRAEQDNAIRREGGIEKWQRRQRKGDIRRTE